MICRVKLAEMHEQTGRFASLLLAENGADDRLQESRLDSRHEARRKELFQMNV